ncbi:MAG: signal peptide peptidase SppA [Desulfobacterales bacterium]|nr:signal peptide peptidase SppA [Desulfobacterales bacterium]
MFSRRHPILFFFLIFSAIASVTVIVVTTVVALAIRGDQFHGLMEDGGSKVGVVEITGVIADARKTLETLKYFREDDTIQAVMVRIDSPGGAVGPSQEIYRAVRKTSETKKVVASLGSVAASGGYYIAAAADGIMANPGTITGSIGVIMGFTNFEGLLEKIGLFPVVIKSGEYKDMGSPVREMRPDERNLLQGMTQKIHGQFVSDVAKGRHLPLEKVQSLADGRIFTGEESVAMGLVDRLGNFDDALEWTGRMAGIEGEVEAVYPQERRFSYIEMLTGSSIEEMAANFFRSELWAGFLYTP